MRLLLLLAVALLAGCASTPVDELLASSEVVRELPRETGERIEVARFSRRSPAEGLASHWQPYIILPSKPRTEYKFVHGAEGGAL